MFNMSVGYDLEGVKGEKVDTFLNGMMDACRNAYLPGVHRRVSMSCSRMRSDYIDTISPDVSRSVTVSTLHGCPPEEIERIATYLIDGKGAAHLRQVQSHPAGL
ncbi:MAG: hypothetical protein ACLSHO_09280 [Dysosmobacter sp.]